MEVPFGFAPGTGKEAPLPRPSPRTLAGLMLLGEALALGLLGNALFAGAALGLNALLWVGALLAAVGALARRTETELEGEGRWMAFPALFFAAALAWRGSPTLAAVNVLAITLALGLGAWRAREGTLRDTRVGQYLAGLLSTWLRGASGLFVVAVGEVEWRTVAPAGRSARAMAVGRGLLLAAPLLVVFGALFASADRVFAQGLESLFRWDPEVVVAAGFRVLFWGWVAAGVAWAALHAPSGKLARGTPVPLPKLGITEVATALALLDALFLAFVAVQARYLFGGQAWVSAAETGWGEYARAGFFELVWVAALVLPLLLGLNALLREADGRAQRVFRVLAGTLVALLLVVMASAMERMRLYQAAYGLTELRLYTSVFMGWLAVVFAWLCATVLCGRAERFPKGAVMAGFAAVAALNVLNPDALIARVNLDRGAAGGRVDTGYLATSLGPDAAPVLARAYPRLPAQERCAVGRTLAGWGRREGGWRGWSWSRTEAGRIARRGRWTDPAGPCPAPRATPAPR